jgi:hypothetical protein
MSSSYYNADKLKQTALKKMKKINKSEGNLKPAATTSRTSLGWNNN